MVYGGGHTSGPGQGQPAYDPEATQVVPGFPQAPPQVPPPGYPPQPGYAPHPGYAPVGPPPEPEPPSGPSRRTIVLLGVAIVALLTAGGVGVGLLLSSGQSPDDTTTAPPTGEPTPSTSPSTQPASDTPPPPSPGATGTNVDISARASDPAPLTVAEVFPGKAISFNGATYTVHGTEAATDCKKASDATLGPALATAGCNQIVRATVSDPSNQYLVTIGIANLPTRLAADDVYERVEDPAKNGYFARLSGTGPAKDFAANRDTVVGSLARGHYVIFAIAGRPGTTGASLADEQLKTALRDLRQYANEVVSKRSS